MEKLFIVLDNDLYPVAVKETFYADIPTIPKVNDILPLVDDKGHRRHFKVIDTRGISVVEENKNG